MLDTNGSFYYDDRRLAQETRLTESTIRRAKRFLRQEKYIFIKNGVSKGKATEYWILRKPDRKTPFVDISKPINFPAKAINQSLKAYQNDTPNKVTNKDINNSVFNSASKEDLKNGIIGLAISNGPVFAKRFYLEQGISEEDIMKALDSMSNSTTN